MALSEKHEIVNMEKSSEDDPTLILRAQDKLTESVNDMLRAQDRLVEAIIEISRSLAAYHDGAIQDGLNKQNFFKSARRDNKE